MRSRSNRPAPFFFSATLGPVLYFPPIRHATSARRRRATAPRMRGGRAGACRESTPPRRPRELLTPQRAVLAPWFLPPRRPPRRGALHQNQPGRRVVPTERAIHTTPPPI